MGIFAVELGIRDIIYLLTFVASIIVLYFKLREAIYKKADKTEINKMKIHCSKHDTLRKEFDEHKQNFKMHVNAELWEKRFADLKEGQKQLQQTSVEMIKLISEGLSRRVDNGNKT